MHTHPHLSLQQKNHPPTPHSRPHICPPTPTQTHTSSVHYLFSSLKLKLAPCFIQRHSYVLADSSPALHCLFADELPVYVTICLKNGPVNEGADRSALFTFLNLVSSSLIYSSAQAKQTPADLPHLSLPDQQNKNSNSKAGCCPTPTLTKAQNQNWKIRIFFFPIQQMCINKLLTSLHLL